jgi:hypothetical protein
MCNEVTIENFVYNNFLYSNVYLNLFKRLHMDTTKKSLAVNSTDSNIL